MKKLLGIFLFFFAFLSNGQTVSITSSATGAVFTGTSVTFATTTSRITSPSFQWYKNSGAGFGYPCHLRAVRTF
jgi:hypothetical protein